MYCHPICNSKNSKRLILECLRNFNIFNILHFKNLRTLLLYAHNRSHKMKHKVKVNFTIKMQRINDLCSLDSVFSGTLITRISLSQY